MRKCLAGKNHAGYVLCKDVEYKGRGAGREGSAEGSQVLFFPHFPHFVRGRGLVEEMGGEDAAGLGVAGDA